MLLLLLLVLLLLLLVQLLLLLLVLLLLLLVLLLLLLLVQDIGRPTLRDASSQTSSAEMRKDSKSTIVPRRPRFEGGGCKSIEGGGWGGDDLPLYFFLSIPR